MRLLAEGIEHDSRNCCSRLDTDTPVANERVRFARTAPARQGRSWRARSSDCLLEPLIDCRPNGREGRFTAHMVSRLRSVCHRVCARRQRAERRILLLPQVGALKFAQVGLDLLCRGLLLVERFQRDGVGDPSNMPRRDDTRAVARPSARPTRKPDAARASAALRPTIATCRVIGRRDRADFRRTAPLAARRPTTSIDVTLREE